MTITVDEHFLYLQFPPENDENGDFKKVYAHFLLYHLRFLPHDKKMSGGYWQRVDDLTIPYQYFVKFIENNPASYLMASLFKKKIPPAPAPTTPPPTSLSSSSSIFSIFSKSTKQPPPSPTPTPPTSSSLIFSIFSKSTTPQPQPPDTNDTTPPPPPDDDTPDDTTQPPPPDDDTQPPPPDDTTQPLPPSPPPNDDNDTTPPEQNVMKIKKIVNQIPLYNIENDVNGKNIKEIFNMYKNKETTLEDFEIGVNYDIMEKITTDIKKQLTFFLKEYHLIFKEINQEYVYNINDTHVIIDMNSLFKMPDDDLNFKKEHENNMNKLKEFVKEMLQNEFDKIKKTKIEKELIF